jgi:hypothetical protein
MTVNAHVARALAIATAVGALASCGGNDDAVKGGPNARTAGVTDTSARPAREASGDRPGDRKDQRTGQSATRKQGRHLDQPDQRQEVDAGAGRDRADDADPVPSTRARNDGNASNSSSDDAPSRDGSQDAND